MITWIFKKAIKIAIILIILALAAVGAFSIAVSVAKVEPTIYNDSNTYYIAHRGLSSEYYQNTYEAFYYAAESDFFYGIETDVYFTSDDQIVCCHDEDPFEDSSLLVSELDYATAMQTPLLRYEDDMGAADSDIYMCDFATYLAVCKEGGKVPIIEIKAEATSSQLKLLVAEVETYFSLDEVVFISFKNSNLTGLMDISQDIVVQQLCSNIFKCIYYVNAGYTVSISQNTAEDSTYFLDVAGKNNTAICIWTVNDKETALMYAEMGYNFIVTDYDFSK